MYAFLLNKKLSTFSYFNSNLNIELLPNFKDLNIIFDSKSNYSVHTEMLRNKAMRNLIFFKTTCASFIDSSALITMYCSLVCLNLKYCLLM